MPRAGTADGSRDKIDEGTCTPPGCRRLAYLTPTGSTDASAHRGGRRHDAPPRGGSCHKPWTPSGCKPRARFNERQLGSVHGNPDGVQTHE